MKITKCLALALALLLCAAVTAYAGEPERAPDTMLAKVDSAKVDSAKVQTTVLGTERSLDQNVLRGIARTTVGRALEMLPSLSLYDNGIASRGRSPIETQVRVDGLTINDPVIGGLGVGGATFSPSMPSPYALRSVNVKSGGYGAEYGGANSAVINTIVNTGNTERITGVLNWHTDVPVLFGSAGNGIKAGAPKEDVADVAIAGPLGFNNSTFSLSMRNTFQNNRNFGLQVLDPVGNNLGELPNNRTWSRNILGRVKLEILPNVSLLVGGMLGVVNAERSSWEWLYATEEVNGLTERMAKQAVVQQFASNVFAQLTHTLNSNTMFDLRFSFNRNSSETGKRKSSAAPNVLNGFDLWMPEDAFTWDNSHSDDTVGTQFVAGSNRALDAYDVGGTMVYTEDGMLRIQVPTRNPLTGFIEGAEDRSSTTNPYGLTNYFASRGNEGGVDFFNAQYMQLDGNVTHTIDGEGIRQTFRAGFEARMYRLSRHSNSSPWVSASYNDVYGPDYGGNLYLDSSITNWTAVKQATEAPYHPVTAGAYVQDQIVLAGIVITPGLRLEYLDADALYRSTQEPFTPFGSDSGFVQTTAKLNVSPRISITYPLNASGRQAISAAYGVYYQTQPFGELYESGYATRSPGQIVGNPDADMQRMTQYQAAYNHQLTDELAFSITGYYRETDNQSALKYVPSLPDPYYLRTQSAFGVSRGIEFTFEKRVVDNWGVNLNYTLATTTVSALDRTHRINGIVMLGWGAGEGPMIDGVPFLEHFGVNLSGYWQTGLVYRTSPTNFGTQERLPSNWNTDLRVMRTFPLSGLLGVGTEVDVFIDATNLLNITDAIALYPRTGNADYDGSELNRVIGDFPSTTYFKSVDPANKESIARSQYDAVGKRRYYAAIDTNADGQVTPQESYKGYLAYVDTVIARHLNYQYPRQVYVGVTFRF